MKAHSLAAWTAAFFLSASLFSHTVALRLLLLIAGTAFAVAAIVKDRSAIRLLPPIWPTFALWALWAAVSLAWSEDVARSAKEFRNEVVYAGLALWLCFIGAQAANAARILLPVVTLAAVALCGVAFFHFVAAPETYGSGLHAGQGTFSSTLLTLLPGLILFAWYHYSRRNARALLVAAALGILAVVSAYTTMNRTVWLGFGVQLLVIGGLLLFYRPASLKGSTKALAAAGAIVVATATVAITAVVHYEREAAQSAVSLKEDPRLRLWPEAVELIREQPVKGYGFGRGLMRETLREETGDSMLWHAHNLFLDTALQTGLAGLALLLALLAHTVLAGWHAARAPSDWSRACGIALIAVVAGMLVRNMTDVLWVRQSALLYWGVAGVLLAWGASRASTRA